MNSSIRLFFSLLLVVFMATGCVTQKQLTYLRNVSPATADSVNQHFTPRIESTIKAGDALTILVSALDKEAVAPYNLPAVSFNSPDNTTVLTTTMLQCYRVDEAGDIDFPVLGKLHVAGMLRTDVEAMLKSALEKQVLNPLVQVNLIGAKVSVLGEVARPGNVPMTNGRLTVLEALAAAGDMTPYGKRSDVLVTREQDGKMEFARLDLHSPDIYASPYFYLQQNDVVYVSPNKVRAISSTNVSLWLSMVSTVASAATVIVTVVNVARPAASSSSSK